MKLPTLATIFTLISIFTSFTTAKITIEDLPPILQAGSWYDVKYTSDRDYVSPHPVSNLPLSTQNLSHVPKEIKEFLVMSWGLDGKRTGQIINHFIYKPAGKTSAPWRVPNVKDGWVYNNSPFASSSTESSILANTTSPILRDYWLFISAYEELDESKLLSYNGTRISYHNSNTFEIYGGPTLYQNEIAWIVLGTLGGLILLVGVWVVVARVWRKRRGVAVDVSEGGEERYRDDAGRLGRLAAMTDSRRTSTWLGNTISSFATNKITTGTTWVYRLDASCHSVWRSLFEMP
jgi:hypothetical protein